jgi:hypothetical protein
MISLHKGQAYSSEYTSVDYPSLDEFWSGSVSIYTSYPSGVAVLVIPLVKTATSFILSITVDEILQLESTLHAFVISITNSQSNETLVSVEYAMVIPLSAVSPLPMCVISMIIAKLDGTPAGKETRVLTNTLAGAVVTLGWEGIPVFISNTIADKVSESIVDTEVISAKTNAAGYVQFSVIKGLAVIVSCPAFGKTIPVDTTGHDTIDLSSYF